MKKKKPEDYYSEEKVLKRRAERERKRRERATKARMKQDLKMYPEIIPSISPVTPEMLSSPDGLRKTISERVNLLDTLPITSDLRHKVGATHISQAIKLVEIESRAKEDSDHITVEIVGDLPIEQEEPVDNG